MKKIITLLLALCVLTPALGLAQITCSPGGDLVVFANYDGGVLNINCDANIPNLKIGICTYEPVTINLSGPFVGNVVEVRYAGYVSTNNFHCANSPSTTTITGVSPGITSVNFLPAATLSNPNGNSSIVCAYSCNTTTSQGGCNTADQIKAYFQTTMGGTLVSYYTQYGCWSTSPYAISAGGNCCSSIVACATTANAGTDQNICLGGSASLSGSGTGVTTYSWSPATGLSNASIANPTASPTATTTYVLTTSDGGSCSASDTVVITVTPLPVSVNSQSICENGGPVALSGGTPAGGTYSGTFVSSNLFDPALSGPGNHTISYTYTDQFGCYGTASGNVTVFAAPTVTVAPETDICENDNPITLSGGSPAGGTYSGTGVSGSTFDPAAAGAGTHTLTYSYTDVNGCIASDTTPITVIPNPASPVITIGSNELYVVPAGDSTTWMYNGNVLSANGDTLNQYIDGIYQAIIWVNGCPSDTAALQLIIQATGDPMVRGYQIFPNPAQNMVTIQNQNGGSFTVELYDLAGKVLSSANSQGSTCQLSVHDFASGVYLIGITDQKQRTFQRIIKE